MAFDPVAAVLSLTRDELRYLLFENPGLLFGLKEHMVLWARGEAAADRAERAFEDYLALVEKNAATAKGRLTAHLAAEAAYDKSLRAEKAARKFHDQALAAQQAERGKR